MAVINSDDITAGNPAKSNHVGIVAVKAVVSAWTPTNADTVNLFKLPPGATLLDLKLIATTTFGATTPVTYSIGVTGSTALIASAAAMAGGTGLKFSMADAASAALSGSIGYTNGASEVNVTLTTTAINSPSAGTLVALGEYSMDA